ncbi:MAG: ribonuclease P protein component [Cyanobacteria bacterium J06639_1]
MLPQRHRLRDRSVFQTLYKKGQRSRGRWLTVLCKPREPRPSFEQSDLNDTRDLDLLDERAPADKCDPVELPTRWAIVVSKKVSRRAVDRNRIRRRIRGALRQLEPQWRSGWDVIAIVKPTPKERDRPYLLDCSYPELQQEVETLVRRAGLLDAAD